MAVFKFGNFEADIDTSDYEFMQKFETYSIKLGKDEEKVDKTGMRSEAIRQICALTFQYFNDLFGEGTDRLLFGSATNLRMCDQAIFALASAIEEDKKAYDMEVKAGVSKYSGNRAQRRKTKKTGGAK